MNVGMRVLFRTLFLAVLAVALVTGCSKGGAGNTVQLGYQPTSEQEIIANMLKKLIEANSSLKVEMVGGLGGTPVVLKAMQNNDIQISAVRYVGTDLTSSLGMTEFPKDPAAAFDLVKQGVKEKFDQEWFPSYGFDNTYIFTVRKDIAEKYGLKKISDLQAHAAEMKLATDAGWLERTNDGYPAFKKEYGLEFAKAIPMDIGLVYKAVKNGDVDIVLAYSTDSRLKEYDLVTLEDDKHFFPNYTASPVVRNDALKKHPELADILNKLAGKIDTKTMTALNYQADVEKLEPAEIAQKFLTEQGLLQP
ncbi:glycine betaine/carnitine/choline-binding protein OpuCC [Brevibacillus agri]|uniref:Glycine betaine/carnitine/choline-binding protein OpuCC n=2 Tax=Brevibacillus TaxID=55080 RepID=A0ABQ0SVF9_9BACL|nr:glycine betaine/carnitine/choline-binding protein OpuCC [Brevibacillus agri]